MKVQVKVTVQLENKAAEPQAARSVQLAVFPEDTLANVKERVVAVEPLPFPDQQILILGGKELSDESLRLADLGVADGSSLELVVRASEAALTKQLQELLQAKALPHDELSLLYSHRHGLKVSQVLKVLGLGDEQLTSFVQRQKRLRVNSGFIEVAHQSEAGSGFGAAKQANRAPAAAFDVSVSVTLKHPSRVDEIIATSLMVKPADTVLSLKERVLAAELLPLPGAILSLGGKDLGDQQSLEEAGISEDSRLNLVARASERVFARQLVDLLQGRILSAKELGDLYCCRNGATVYQAMDVCGNGEKFKDFLKRQRCFSMGGGAVRLSMDLDEQHMPALVGSYAAHPNEVYLELYSKIYDQELCKKATGMATRIADSFSACSFLNISHSVHTGSVGRGTAIERAADSKVIFFLNGLPDTGCSTWLPPLLQAAASGLREHLNECAQGLAVEVADSDDAVRVTSEQDKASVDLHFSPAFDSTEEALACLRAQDTDGLPSRVVLAEQQLHFIQTQPENVKVAMRLLKWWRAQQQWSSPQMQPSDELLELVAAYAAVQSQPADVRAVVEGALMLLAHASELQVVWPSELRIYIESDVPEHMWNQRPLMLGPINPFVNVIDPEFFDSSELEVLAARTEGLFA